MPTFSNIGVDEPTTIDLRVETVDIVQGATTVRREVVCLGDPDSSNALVASTNAQPASTIWGLVVRPVGDSTVTPLAGSTWNVRPLQSSAADLQVTARLVDSSAVVVPASTSMPLNGANGYNIRQVMPTLRSTGFSTFGNTSTSNTVVSSVAAQRVKVYAYSITSTVQAVNEIGFWSSAASLLWPIQLQSFSSGVSGANLAVTPPAWLFGTAAGDPLVAKVTGSTGSYRVAFSYFQEA